MENVLQGMVDIMSSMPTNQVWHKPKLPESLPNDDLLELLSKDLKGVVEDTLKPISEKDVGDEDENELILFADILIPIEVYRKIPQKQVLIEMVNTFVEGVGDFEVVANTSPWETSQVVAFVKVNVSEDVSVNTFITLQTRSNVSREGVLTDYIRTYIRDMCPNEEKIQELYNTIASQEMVLKMMTDQLVKSAQERTSIYERELEGILSNYRNQLEQYNNSRNAVNIARKFLKEIIEVGQDVHNLEVSVVGGNIRMKFLNVECEDMMGNHEQVYDLGDVSVDINLMHLYSSSNPGRSELIVRLVGTKTFRGYSGVPACHPHDLGEGRPCLGTFQADMLEATVKGDARSLVALSKEFVSTYNSQDEAGMQFLNHNDPED